MLIGSNYKTTLSAEQLSELFNRDETVIWTGRWGRLELTLKQQLAVCVVFA